MSKRKFKRYQRQVAKLVSNDFASDCDIFERHFLDRLFYGPSIIFFADGTALEIRSRHQKPYRKVSCNCCGNPSVVVRRRSKKRNCILFEGENARYWDLSHCGKTKNKRKIKGPSAKIE